MQGVIPRNLAPVTTAMMLRVSAVALALAVAATVGRAQACVLANDTQPGLRAASISIAMIADVGPRARPTEKPAIFRHALNQLYDTNPGARNQIGSQYLLGRLYAIWLFVDLPATKAVTARACSSRRRTTTPLSGSRSARLLLIPGALLR